MKNLKMIYVSAFTFLALSLNVMLSSCGKGGVGIDEKELNEKELNKKVETENSQELEQGKEEDTENNKDNRNEWRALYPNIAPFIDHSQELQRGLLSESSISKEELLKVIQEWEDLNEEMKKLQRPLPLFPEYSVQIKRWIAVSIAYSEKEYNAKYETSDASSIISSYKDFHDAVVYAKINFLFVKAHQIKETLANSHPDLSTLAQNFIGKIKDVEYVKHEGTKFVKVKKEEELVKLFNDSFGKPYNQMIEQVKAGLNNKQ
ncbi:hypothetical protein HMPREF1981_01482 [Bacteroides pyogenes F0041]|uniref:Lipoprotein n=1 Tax=Bacteroides pyogenes F0041 TaxID=1321819 RepID=U2CNQ7_9BACE|nr:hypothetical protein [Bacteroides pyogenes]ERI85683.1 hypothetical protein HMPREF1981_01482 [Bacteroides pyogenes F0041]MBB3894455.1 hypothetical protein [Bacteroides pyogenes]SUV32298.1 Uncharacterised protein [Bacteroides pyogenes]